MKFQSLLDSFKGMRALVVGDLMLDEYIFGRVTRISQEAPVMVVRQSSTRAVPGGAANVAKNMVALGAQPIMVGVVGGDVAGQTLAEALEESGISADGLVTDEARPTTRKTRVIANHSHQVLRIDHEDEQSVSGDVEAAVLASAMRRLDEVNLLVISDYVKGAVTGRIIESLVEAARHREVPVVANPKPKSLAHYRGASLVSLNEYEGGLALGKPEGIQLGEAEAAASQLRSKLGVDRMLVTLGANGMAAATAHDGFLVPAVRVEVYDEAGAGDTVIATIALAIGANRFGPVALELAAQTAASVVKRVGVAVPTDDDLTAIGAIEAIGVY